MPTRLLNSSVFKWPDLNAVDKALRNWAKKVIFSYPDIIRIGYFGSYANNNWGVGSDLDLIVIIKDNSETFRNCQAEIFKDVTELPVPVDLFIYTLQEWNSFEQNSKFHQMLLHSTVWIYNKTFSK